jgi:chromosome segregation ATPase
MEISSITQDTLIPLGLLGIIGGGIFWLSSVNSDVKFSKQRLKDVEEKLMDIENKLQNNETTQARLLEKMISLEKSLDELKKLLVEWRSVPN